jgi:outer membrane lipoprotein SlyB
MTDEVKKDEWYIGKYAGKVAKATWEGTKKVAGTIADHPVAGTVGAVTGFVVAGPVGAVGGAAAGAGIAKSVKEEKEKK